jgi:hypothetical protein
LRHSKYRTEIKGNINGGNFSLEANYEKMGPSSKDFAHRIEKIFLMFPVCSSPKFYFAQGNLPGSWERKSSAREIIHWTKSAYLGKALQKFFNSSCKPNQKSTTCSGKNPILPVLEFEKGEMIATILSDYNDERETEITKIVKLLSEIVEKHKEIFG